MGDLYEPDQCLGCDERHEPIADCPAWAYVPIDIRSTHAAYHRELRIQWAWAWIDDKLCIGMEGNLDTIHDATMMITGGFLPKQAVENLAQHLVDQHNKEIAS